LWAWQPEILPIKGWFQASAHQWQDQHSTPKHISCVLHDRTGGLWLGTWSSGVYRTDLASGGFSQLLAKTSQQAPFIDEQTDKRVFSITGNLQGKLWLSMDQGATLLDPDTGRQQFFRITASKKKVSVLLICVFHQTIN